MRNLRSFNVSSLSMKAGRAILLAAGVIVFVAVLMIAIGASSAFQTWAARRALANRPDISGTIGTVSAGWRHVQLRDIRLEWQGAVLRLPSLDAEVPLVAAGLSDDVKVRNVVARGWTLDLSNVDDLSTLARRFGLSQRSRAMVDAGGFSVLSSAYAAENVAPDAFRGVLTQLELPVDLAIDGVDLAGEVILPRKDFHAARVAVTLTGGGLAAGQEGTFRLEAAGAKPDGTALSLRSTIAAAMNTPRTFTRFAAMSAASASGTQLPEGVQLDIETSAARTATGEDYRLHLASGGKTLADIKAALVEATAHVAGTWKFDIRHRDVAPFSLGQTLPEFTMVGEGGFETDGTFREVHGDGSLNASIDRLDSLMPELAAVGPTRLKADFDVLQHGESLRIERLDASIDGDAPVAVVRALQPFEFNVQTAELSVADPQQELVGITLTGVPLAWAKPFLDNLQARGGNLTGEFAASARGGGLALRTKTPLAVDNVSLTQDGVPLLIDLDVAVTASADYTPEGWQAQIVKLEVRNDAATLLSLDAKAGQLAGSNQPVKVTGGWSADLPGWLSQPLVQGQLQLSAGRAKGEFSASLDGIRALDTKLTLTDLIAPGNERLPAVNLELRADITPEGEITFNAPLLFDQKGRKSDLLIAGSVTPEQDVSRINARVSGEHVVVEDIQLLLLLIPSDEVSVPEEKTEEKPFWEGFAGELTLALKKVVYGAAYEVSDVGGTIKIESGALKFESVNAAFGPESDLKLSGGVTFTTQPAPTYRLAGEMAVENFDTAPAFRAINPAKLPTVEAKFDLNGRIAGEGENLAQAIEQTRAQFKVTSTGGVFRALATVLPSELHAAAPTALSIVGDFLGGSAAETATAAAEIVRILSEIPFDQLSFEAGRDDNLNLVLRDFSLISPAVRLGGAGQVTYSPDKPLLQQALDMEFTMAARGRLGELMNQVKMLKAEKDSLGYTAFTTPIKIGGTLGQTDTSDLRTKLLNLALEKSGVGDAINKILGGGKE